MTWSVIQNKRIYIERKSCFFFVSFAMPDAVTLSHCISVGGCLCPSSCRSILGIFPSLELSNRSPSYDSAADTTTSFNIKQNKYIAPFILIGSTLLDFETNI